MDATTELYSKMLGNLMKLARDGVHDGLLPDDVLAVCEDIEGNARAALTKAWRDIAYLIEGSI